MASVKFATFTDIHVSDTNPGARIGNYKEDILNKLRYIRDEGKAAGVDFYVCGGDVFHIKAPMRNSYGTTIELIDLFKSFEAPIYCIEGNHDIQYDRVDTLNNQPLGVLYKSGALIQLRKHGFVQNGISVSLRGFPFEEEPDLPSLPKYDEKSDIGICALHLYATPRGGMLFKTKLFSYKELAVLNDDIFVLGHYHVDNGAYKVSRKGREDQEKTLQEQYFINVGAVCRGALDEDSLTRTPKFTINSVSKDEGGMVSVQIKQHKIPIRPPAEVFDIQKKTENDEKTKEAEEFVESLRKQTLSEDLSASNLTNELGHLDIEKDIMEMFKLCMQEAGKALDKTAP